MKKQGYTKCVLEAQIRKYEEILNCDDSEIIQFWITADCPMCDERLKPMIDCLSAPGYQDCLAVVDGLTCIEQSWWNRLGEMLERDDSVTFRQILKTRLKYWKKIYVTKYPKAKIWWTK